MHTATRWSLVLSIPLLWVTGCNSHNGVTTTTQPPLRSAGPIAIGCPAPEIEGEDIDGVPFKLSDYRGKAVMLDFWGNW
jgi:hypothetical protein